MIGQILDLIRVVFTFVLIGCVFVVMGPAIQVVWKEATQTESQEDYGPDPLKPADTSSPSATLNGFIDSAIEAARRWEERQPRFAINRANDRVRRHLDLSYLPEAAQADVGDRRALQLLQLLARIDPGNFALAPDASNLENQDLLSDSWTIPDTEIVIARTAEGIYSGEWQFTRETVERLPLFYKRIEHLPYQDYRAVGLYETLLYAPGPLMPRESVQALPEWSHKVVFGQTLWQWGGAVLIVILLLLLARTLYYWGSRFDHPTRGRQRQHYAGRVFVTLLIIAFANAGAIYTDSGLNLTETADFAFSFILRGIGAAAFGWLIVLVLNAIGEMIIRARSAGRRGANKAAGENDAIDAQLIRIIVRILSIIGLIYAGLVLADSFGIPAAPLIASLGVGGLAIALAVRPTLENIVGGFILFADRPVKVGEFCVFNDKMGTVEQIGLRSTRLRGLDRTVITVPNADFAQIQIVNFTRRDNMLFRTTLGLRYETTPDQLRFVLTQLRELFVAHPMINRDPARARFIGFSASSLDIEVFAYVDSRDYNEYLAVAEDLNLRIIDIVEEAGTGFAFPSQTAYLARDTGLDDERREAAEARIRAWREEGELPFPRHHPERLDEISSKLDYPPKGSVEHRIREEEAARAKPQPRWWHAFWPLFGTRKESAG